MATRRAPSPVRQWPTVLVLLVLVAGFVLVVVDADFQRGSVVIAGAVCLAALLRLVLPNRWAGLLRVRSRVVDTATLFLLGAGGLVAALALIYDWDVDLLLRLLRDRT